METAQRVKVIEPLVKGTEQAYGAEEWRARRAELARGYRNPVGWTEHPYVVRVEGYRGGRPIILGSGVSVQSIVVYHLHHKMPMEELLEGFPHLQEAQIYDALSYYYDHREEIDKDIELNNNTEYWMRKYPPGKYEVQQK